MGVYNFHHDSGKSDRPGPVLHEYPQEMEQQNNKVYVEVIADFSSDGRLRPIQLVWENGRSYRIDRILRSDRRESLKAGGTGIRYVCSILGQTMELYYEGEGRWFVNRKSQ